MTDGVLYENNRFEPTAADWFKVTVRNIWPILDRIGVKCSRSSSMKNHRFTYEIKLTRLAMLLACDWRIHSRLLLLFSRHWCRTDHKWSSFLCTATLSMWQYIPYSSIHTRAIELQPSEYKFAASICLLLILSDIILSRSRKHTLGHKHKPKRNENKCQQ